jgi:hypothetical protein
MAKRPFQSIAYVIFLHLLPELFDFKRDGIFDLPLKTISGICKKNNGEFVIERRATCQN